MRTVKDKWKGKIEQEINQNVAFVRGNDPKYAAEFQARRNYTFTCAYTYQLVYVLSRDPNDSKSKFVVEMVTPISTSSFFFF